MCVCWQCEFFLFLVWSEYNSFFFGGGREVEGERVCGCGGVRKILPAGNTINVFAVKKKKKKKRNYNLNEEIWIREIKLSLCFFFFPSLFLFF